MQRMVRPLPLAVAVLVLAACADGKKADSPPLCSSGSCLDGGSDGSPAGDASSDLPPPDLAADLAADVAADLAADLSPDLGPDSLPEVRPLEPDAGSADARDAGPGGLAISPGAHEFMSTLIGTSDSFTFTASNPGDSPVAGFNVSSTGADFVIPVASNQCAGVATLAPAASCTLVARFQPITRGPRMGAIIVNAAGQTVTASLTGVGLAPAHLAVAPQSVSLAGVVGKEGLPTSVLAANVGDAPTGALTVMLGGASADEFLITSNGCLTPLASASSCQVTLAVKGRSPGAKAATLTVSSPMGEMAVCLLTATVTAAEQLTITPGAKNFGPVAVGGASVSTEFEVRNIGGSATAPLTVSPTTVDFVVTANTCGGTALQPNGTCMVSVVFEPVSLGARSALLTVTAGGSFAFAQLSGSGF
jgi:hypothetical protein